MLKNVAVVCQALLFPWPESQNLVLIFIFHIEKIYSVTRFRLYGKKFKRKKWWEAIIAHFWNSIPSMTLEVVNILYPMWCWSTKNAFAARTNFFFFLSDNEISQGSHVPNYVQFLTAQRSYSKTAVKSNVGVTQINFCHSLQLAGSHDYRGLPPCIPSRAPGTSSLRETPLSGLHCPKRKSWTAFKNNF